MKGKEQGELACEVLPCVSFFLYNKKKKKCPEFERDPGGFRTIGSLQVGRLEIHRSAGWNGRGGRGEGLGLGEPVAILGTPVGWRTGPSCEATAGC